MLQEIRQQPEALVRTLRAESPKIASLGRFLATRDIRLIILVARGSSDNAALFDVPEITSRIPVSLAAPSSTRCTIKTDQNALVVGVSVR
jgi:glucosamine--fructose-6-phosphate aminotransferase (isomerizing)